MNKLLIYSPEKNIWLHFSRPVKIFQADTQDKALKVINQVENAVHAGYHCAGFISYEAASVFDKALITKQADGFPLVWFGVYKAPEETEELPAKMQEFSSQLQWNASLTPAGYKNSIARIRRLLSAGYTYQVNFSYRLVSNDVVEPYSLFTQMVKAQKAPYAAYLETDNFAICSASPELFFRLENKSLVSKPMKGTLPRGLTYSADMKQARKLREDKKNRAENVMIIDMVRNDMGRIAIPGSVKVSNMFQTEKYPTLWQMTSTVTSQTDASFFEVLRALFPCASITGAPKPGTMKIITDLEDSPRHIYTGSIGYLAPGRKAQFNVAIRTALVEKNSGRIEYGVGGGIVWDSEDKLELEECNVKARIITGQVPDFELLESILWNRNKGFFLLPNHLRRLRESAAYFDFKINTDAICDYLDRMKTSFNNECYKVRLLVSQKGTFRAESIPLPYPSEKQKPLKICLASFPVDKSSVYLYHKTTVRDIYNKALTEHPDCDDVILWNTDGEITESCIANIVVELGDAILTPPVKSGLLAGTYRQWMLDNNRVKEAPIRICDLNKCKNIFLINSVQGQRKALLANCRI